MTADAIKYNNDTALSNQYIYDNDGNLVRQKNHQCNDNGQPLTVNYQYNYDSNDRIVGKGYSGIEYFNHYDSKGQLVREDYRLCGIETYTYAYDSRGNITSKNTYNYTTGGLDNATPTSTKTFTYASSGWTDKLTAVDNTSLTYDDVGNVLTYGNRSFTWSAGRNLAQITEGDDTYSYTYDENGIRTSKTVNGVTTQYNTKDGVILAQSDGTNTMTFQYDTSGQPLGFTYNGTQYLYMVDVQGNVFGVANTEGTAIGQYDYDEWGNPVDSYTVDNATTAEVTAFNANPLRYRGYYYDQETGYYYLQSRYYDPSICRFINSDVPEIAQEAKDEDIGLNIFAYCCNDAVNNDDPTGFDNKKIYVFYYYNKNSNNNLDGIAKNATYYNTNNKNVVLKAVSSSKAFISAWNSMKSAKTVYLFLHGGKGKLVFYNGDNMSSSKILDSLKTKKVSKAVYLFSCKGGAGDKKKKVAYSFAKITKTTVYALPVGVSYGYCGATMERYAKVQLLYYYSHESYTYWHKYNTYNDGHGNWAYFATNLKIKEILY